MSRSQKRKTVDRTLSAATTEAGGRWSVGGACDGQRTTVAGVDIGQARCGLAVIDCAADGSELRVLHVECIHIEKGSTNAKTCANFGDAVLERRELFAACDVICVENQMDHLHLGAGRRNAHGGLMHDLQVHLAAVLRACLGKDVVLCSGSGKLRLWIDADDVEHGLVEAPKKANYAERKRWMVEALRRLQQHETQLVRPEFFDQHEQVGLFDQCDALAHAVRHVQRTMSRYTKAERLYKRHCRSLDQRSSEVVERLRRMTPQVDEPF